MRTAALTALLVTASAAQAQPFGSLVARMIDSEYTISRFVQLAPDSAPVVRTRGGARGGSASFNADATASSYGGFFPFNLDTFTFDSLITADLEAHVGFSSLNQLSGSCVAYRFAWIEVHRPIRYRITGEIQSDLTLTDGWGSAQVFVEIVPEVGNTVVRAEASGDEGVQVLELEGVLTPFGGLEWFFITFEASASLTSPALAGQGARALANVSIELLPMGCTTADLALPYGELNSSDIVEFLGAWTDREPIADYEAPEGEFDLTDVMAFLSVFNDGCP